MLAYSTSANPFNISTLINASFNGIVLYEPVRDSDSGTITDFVIAMLNDQALVDYARPREALIGASIRALFGPQEGEQFIRRFTSVLETGQSERFEMTHTSLEGTPERYFDILVSKLDNHVIVNYSDITDRYELRSQRDRQEEQFSAIFQNALTGLACLEPIFSDTGEIIDFRYLLVNRQVLKMASRTPEQVEGKRLLDLYPGVIESGLFAKWVEAYHTGEPTYFLEAYKNEKGKTIWYESRTVRYKNMIIESFNDVTEAQQNQQRAEAATYDLQRSNENLRQFTQVASNDLLNPLRKIVSFSELLQRQYNRQLGDDGIDIINRIHLSAERMTMFLRDLLTYSQVGSNYRGVETFWLTSVITELTNEDLWPLIHQTKAEITVSGLPMLTADRQQIRQLFLNLLSNALKFRRPDVAPIISVTSRERYGKDVPASAVSSAIIVQPIPDGLYYEISVEDNGIGFSDGSKEHIFQAFRRLKTNDQHTTGSGIGLAICRRIVENHRGFIAATGKLDEGAIFQVYLPVGP